MINMKSQEIRLNGEVHPIIRWEVWFATPMGLFTTYSEAVKAVADSDFDPELTVVPVSVAVSDFNVYEVSGKSI